MMNTIIKQNMLRSAMTQIQLIQALLVLVEIPLQAIINNLMKVTRLLMIVDQVDVIMVELKVVDQEMMYKKKLLMIIPKLQKK